MTIINVPYTAGVAPITITEMWAAGMRITEIHRATDWDGTSGTFTEYTSHGGGVRPDLVEGTEAYIFIDSSGDAAYAYKIRHRSAVGKLTDFSDIITVSTGAVVMSSQAMWARYIHPEGYAGTWLKYTELRSVRLTVSRMSKSGNIPYISGNDWSMEMALLYKDANGVWKGLDLTGTTAIALTVTDRSTGNLVIAKTMGAGIVILDQAVEHPSGNRGHLRADFTTSDTPDSGEHNADLVVTFVGGKVEQWSGRFGIAD